MANVFKDISQFTLKSAATGTEEFQVSENVTSQQIANLAKELNIYTVSQSEAINMKIDSANIAELKTSTILLYLSDDSNYTPYLKASRDNDEMFFITGGIPINSQGGPGIDSGETVPFAQIQSVMISIDLNTGVIIIIPYPVFSKSWLGNNDNIKTVKTGSTKAYLGACIGSTTQWTALGNSSEGSGLEDIASTLHEDSKYVQASPGAGMGTSTIITLDRALKSTDVILITWRKSSASVPDAEIAGSTIINPGAYSYDVALEYIENANSDYYGLFIGQSYTEVSSTQLSFYAVSDGAAYGPSYLLTGIYNISGK